jgi:S1-C subfamily serine protease
MKKTTDTGITLLIIGVLTYLIYSNPRPTVHRIQAGGYLGSGISVATTNGRTLILTANHVIQDGGPYTVAGKSATVIATNKTWDLAALVVNETLPVSQLGTKEPQIGDKLTVCGYGYNKYAEATGQVVGFVAPAALDWVVIDASARSGDSGGPLFYQDGTVAAILWGSDQTGAHGTHCLRVRKFLATIKGHDDLLKALDITYNIW